MSPSPAVFAVEQFSNRYIVKGVGPPLRRVIVAGSGSYGCNPIESAAETHKRLISKEFIDLLCVDLPALTPIIRLLRATFPSLSQVTVSWPQTGYRPPRYSTHQNVAHRYLKTRGLYPILNTDRDSLPVPDL